MVPGQITIIPVKPFETGKSRLAPLLSQSERAELNAYLFERTLSLAEELTGARSIIVVSRCEEVLRRTAKRGARPLRETVPGLSEAVRQATLFAEALGATATLVIPTDLVFATVSDFSRVTGEAEPNSLTLVSDRSGTGTNFVFQSPPVFHDFRFGRGSLALHHAVAKSSGIKVRRIRNPNLEFDVDLPQDYLDWRNALATREPEALH